MILLVSASPRALECARIIEQAIGCPACVCPPNAAACNLSRTGEFRVIIFDEAAVAATPSDAAAVLRNAGSALPVHINTALMSPTRIVGEIRAAVLRSSRERDAAVREAGALVTNELNNEITGVLLAAEVALSAPGIPPLVAAKVRDIQQIANRMRRRSSEFESA